MSWEFQWDASKERSNRLKHGVGFEEAATVFEDPLALLVPDPVHSLREERYIVLGCSSQQRTLVVVHADYGDRIRIIGARKATRREQAAYEQTR